MRSLISITILFTAMSITTVVTDESDTATDDSETAIEHCKTLLTKYCKFKNDRSDYVAINYNGNLASVVPEEILININGELKEYLTKNMKIDIQDDKIMNVTRNLNKNVPIDKIWNISVEEVKKFLEEFREMQKVINYDDTLIARRLLFRLLNQYLKFIIEDAVQSLNDKAEYYKSMTKDFAVRFSPFLYNYLTTTSKDLSAKFDSFIPNEMTPAPKVAQFLNKIIPLNDYYFDILTNNFYASYYIIKGADHDDIMRNFKRILEDELDDIIDEYFIKFNLTDNFEDKIQELKNKAANENFEEPISKFIQNYSKDSEDPNGQSPNKYCNHYRTTGDSTLEPIEEFNLAVDCYRQMFNYGLIKVGPGLDSVILKSNPVDHFCQEFIKNNGAKELFLIILDQEAK